MTYPMLSLAVIDARKTPSSGFYVISPAVAKLILETRNKHNRKIAEQKAAGIFDDIVNDRYVPNGECLIFDKNGQLLDGQHQLTAAVKANKAIISNIAFGIEPAYQTTIDQGKSRNAGDAMLIEYGWKNTNVLSAAARFMLGYEASGGTRFSGGINFSTQSLIKWVLACPDIHNIVSWAVGYQNRVSGMTTPSALVIAHLILEPKYGIDAVIFIDAVAMGTNLAPGDPALAARSKLQQMTRDAAKTRKRVSTPQAVEALMICCIAHVKGEKRNYFVLKGSPPRMPNVRRRSPNALKDIL